MKMLIVLLIFVLAQNTYSLENIILEAVLTTSTQDTTIAFSIGDFTGAYHLKGNFYEQGFKPDNASFSRSVELDLANPTVFSWFGPIDNKDVSKYNASISTQGESYTVKFTSSDPSDKYRTVILEDGKEICVYTNQGINSQTGLGEKSDIASGWKASFSNVSENGGKLKLNLSVSKTFIDGETIATEGGFSFLLGQLKVFGWYDKST